MKKEEETVENIPEETNLVPPVEDAQQAQIDALKEQLLRERAENDNLRKRQERQLENAYKFATEGLVKDLLPVVDSLTRGVAAAKENQEAPEAIAHFIEGSEMTLKILREVFQKHGIEEIHPEGEKFNPEQHQAIAAAPNAEVAHNTILNVAQTGYKLNGRVLRAAQVVVAKNEA